MTINLSTENRKSYTYLILFYDGYFYYGVRLCPKGKTPWQDTGYVGSPVTHKDKWNNTQFTKFILEVFDDYNLAQKKEKKLIKPNLNNPICLNESAGLHRSYDSCSKGGKIGGRKSVESGHIQKLGKEWGKINGKELGKKQGKINKESGHIQNLGKIQGKINAESGHLSSIGKIGGKIGGKKQGKINAESGHLKDIANIRYRCLITGFVSTVSGLNKYQKNRGIDISLREKI